MTATLVLTLAMACFICVQGMQEPYYLVQTCCNDGADIGRKVDCTGKPLAIGRMSSDKKMCKAAWLSCCLKELQKQSCKNGAARAMQEQSCFKDGDSKCDKTTEHVCCSQCKVGIHYARAGRACEPAQVNTPFDVVSETCCKNWKKNVTSGSRFEFGKLDKKSVKCANGKCSHKCTDTASGPVCTCPTGYTIAADGVNCLDTDECKANSSICSPFFTCFNNPGSYHCSRQRKCGPGYELSGVTCVDVNECSRQYGICGQGDCFNQAGSYYCRCYSGYYFNSTSKSCKEFNPCHQARCGYKCEDLGRGRYRCSCPDGKVLNEDRKTCRVFDPCERSKCKHKCQAVDKYRYQCTCRAGYQLESDGISCTAETYKVNIEIKNVDPMLSYNLRWKEGRQTRVINIPTSTTVTRNLVFASAKQPESLSFKLYDSRGRLVSISGRDQFVVKLVVGLLNLKLQVGRNDNNPCRASPCSQNCENRGGGKYRCSCRTGYLQKIDGTCEVIVDPCKSNPCQHRCYHSGNGQFSCSCPSGQQLNADKRTCKVDDPCIHKYCQYQCNAVGNKAQCLCPKGFKVEGDRCRDIDECRPDRNLCNLANYKCFNTYGSYKCAPNNCPKSYFQKSGEKFCFKKHCPKGNTDCLADKVTSHQWLYSAVRNQVQPDNAIYYYSVGRPSFNHQIFYRIASGNRDRAFYLVRENNYRVTIKNRKTLVGPKDYQLKLVVSVYKDGVLNSQLTTTFYVYVSAYKFY